MARRWSRWTGRAIVALAIIVIGLFYLGAALIWTAGDGLPLAAPPSAGATTMASTLIHHLADLGWTIWAR